MDKNQLTEAQLDRAIGAILGSAVGDALGAPFEFKPPVSEQTAIEMSGGGAFGWEPGEWTDDTSMQIPILQALARGKNLSLESTLDGIVSEWQAWSKSAPDVGIQTRAVLKSLDQPTASAARRSAAEVHKTRGRSGGNGSLMRTAPVALATINSPEQTAAHARALSDLTHFDQDAGDACVIWSETIRMAILTGSAQIREAVSLIPGERQPLWLERIDDAERHEPSAFENNGWVVSAFQAAWSAVYRADSLRGGLERAVRAGFDTDTVAAIAGGVLGAKFGAKAIPAEWRDRLHGWPGFKANDLEILVRRIDSGQIHDTFLQAYRNLYENFSITNDLEIDMNEDNWQASHEVAFSGLVQDLQAVYLVKGL